MSEFFQKTIYENKETRLQQHDQIEITLTSDGTYVIEVPYEACELTFDELMAMHKAIGQEITRMKSHLKI